MKITFPTITPGHEVFRDGEFLYVRNIAKTFRLTGNSNQLIEQLLHAADGTRSITDLADTVSCSTTDVEGVIGRLQHLGIVTDPASLDVPDGHDFMVANTMQALVPTDRTDHKRYHAMLNKRVLLVGQTELTQEISRRFSEHGLSQIDNLDPALENDEIEQCVVAKQPDLLIHISRFQDYKTALECNRVAIAHNNAWISTWTEGMIITLMPVMLPHQTPCFDCFLERQRAHYLQPEADAAFEQYVMQGRPNSLLKERTQMLFIDQMQVDLLVIRSLRYLMGGKEPVPVDTVIEFDVRELNLTHHPLLRVPNCPSCNPTYHQPPVRPFSEASFVVNPSIAEVK